MSSFACQKIKLLSSASPKTLSPGFNSSPVHTGWDFNITSSNVHPVQNIIRFAESSLHKTQMVLKSNCSSVIEDPWHRNGNHVTNCYSQELLMETGKVTKCIDFMYTSQSVSWVKPEHPVCKECLWPHLPSPLLRLGPVSALLSGWPLSSRTRATSREEKNLQGFLEQPKEKWVESAFEVDGPHYFTSRIWSTVAGFEEWGRDLSQNIQPISRSWKSKETDSLLGPLARSKDLPTAWF